MAEIRRRFAMARQEKQLHVAALLPFVLPAKSLTIKDVADVADFPDLCINPAFLTFGVRVFRIFRG
jgi:hypothetical protein